MLRVYENEIQELETNVSRPITRVIEMFTQLQEIVKNIRNLFLNENKVWKLPQSEIAIRFFKHPKQQNSNTNLSPLPSEGYLILPQVEKNKDVSITMPMTSHSPKHDSSSSSDQEWNEKDSLLYGYESHDNHESDGDEYDNEEKLSSRKSRRWG